MRYWSYAVLEREVRANLVYRDFTRVGAAKMPDAKTIGRWGVAIGPTVIHQIHDRIVQIARTHDVVQGRRMRVDTTVVENNIHYPSSEAGTRTAPGRCRYRTAARRRIERVFRPH